MSDAPRRTWVAMLALVLAGTACGTDSGNQSGDGDTSGSAAMGDVLVRTDPATASECPNGGTVVSSGVDVNHNGVLDADEIMTRSPICTSAAAPRPVLISLREEPPGPHCASGGGAIESGVDSNGNGQLDADEIQHIDYACGDALLTRTAVEPAGVHCAAGGMALLAGLDRDHDGVLSDAEVESTQYACGGVIAGDVVINSSDDAVPLAEIVAIIGSLTINPSVTAASFPELVHVGGGLTISPFAGAPISLPELVDVGGTLTFTNAAALAVPKLVHIGALEMNHSHVLDLSQLTALRQIDGALEIINSDIHQIELSLTSLGSISMADDRLLTSASITTTGQLGAIGLDTSDRITSFDVVVQPLPGVPSTMGEVFIIQMLNLRHVGLAADQIQDIDLITTVSLTDLAITISRLMFELDVEDAAAFDLTLASHDSMLELGTLTISAPLQTWHSSVPIEVNGRCQLDQTLLTALDDQSKLIAVHDTDDGLEITNNSLLRSIAPIEVDASLQVANNAVLSSIDFFDQEDLPGGLSVTDNPMLASAPSLTGLRQIHGGVTIANNPLLTSVFGPTLEAVDTQLAVGGNAGLSSLELPNLAGDLTVLTITGNNALQTLELPQLGHITQTATISTNPVLETLDFSGLAAVRTIFVDNNPELPTCEVLALFTLATGAHGQTGNDDSATCGP